MTTKSYKEHNACVICGNTGIDDMPGYEQHHIGKCRECGFVFVTRIPTIQELIEHYESYGRNDYLSPITIQRYNEILDFLEPFRKTNKLIDVGCGIGHFLSVAKQRGWEVYGTEFTDEAIEICSTKGIHMKKGSLVPSDYEPGSFDVIVSFEVIEHINNPNEELQGFRQLLREEGGLYITTPNFNSFSRRYLKSHWNVICYPEHLGYYTAGTLDLVLKKNGFSKKWIKTTGISLTRIETSKESAETTNDTEDSKEGPVLIGADTKDEILRSKMESNIILKTGKQVANSILDSLRLGDSMKGLFVKAD